MNEEHVDWIAADWGTTNLRCWAMSDSGTVISRAESERGMEAIAAGGGEFEAALLDVVRPWLRAGERMPVMACGMVGAKQGWIEVPYEPVPCSPRTGLRKAPVNCGEMEVFVHAGVSQPEPPDVMRGEETQVAGLLATDPGFAGLACLPGTHTKWIQVAEGEIQAFRTFMTGELFSLLSDQSVLRHTVSPEGWDDAAFVEAVRDSFQRPENFLGACFSLRAESLIRDLGGDRARARLSGLLIGLELASAGGAFAGHEEVVVIANPTVGEIYQSGLAAVGLKSRVVDATEVTLAGLSLGRSEAH